MVWLPRNLPSYVPRQSPDLLVCLACAFTTRQRCLLYVGIEHPVHGLHAALHVVVHVTMEHPRAGHIWNHVSSHELSRPDGGDYVHILTTNAHQVSMPVRSMKIKPHAHGHHVPTHVLALAHGHDGTVAVHVTVDGVFEIAHCEAMPEGQIGIAIRVRRYEFEAIELDRIGDMGTDILIEIVALVFVHDHEKGEELVINVLRRTVRAAHPASGDYNGPDEPGIHVFRLVVMRVVDPHHCTASLRARSGLFARDPGVHVRFAGRDQAIRFWMIHPVAVHRTF